MFVPSNNSVPSILVPVYLPNNDCVLSFLETPRSLFKVGVKNSVVLSLLPSFLGKVCRVLLHIHMPRKFTASQFLHQTLYFPHKWVSLLWHQLKLKRRNIHNSGQKIFVICPEELKIFIKKRMSYCYY